MTYQPGAVARDCGGNDPLCAGQQLGSRRSAGLNIKYDQGGLNRSHRALVRIDSVPHYARGATMAGPAAVILEKGMIEGCAIRE
jgi:hypothetical protein